MGREKMATMLADRYTLDSVVGRGGMGVVWRGEDLVLGREVALKRIGMVPGGVTPDQARAEREARLAASLGHSHVVTVYDLVTEGDEQWLVMEYVEGATLADLVARRGALDPDTAARLLGQAADALTAAHRAGIVHRDVKPSNILVTPAGQVKLTDFGIARGSTDASLTRTGLLSGSPAYLAPEVASGSAAGPESDVWALGATLYHAVTAAAPYDASDNVMAALYRIVHEDPPRPARAGWLLPVLEGTMTKDPVDRWTMAEVRDFLLTRRAPQRAPRTLVQAAPVAAPVAAPLTDAVAARTADEPPSVIAPAADPATGRSPHAARWLAAAGALLAVLLLGVLLAGLIDDDPTDTSSTRAGQESAGAARSPSEAASDAASESPSTQSPSPAAPTPEAMQRFVEDYLATVTRDPAAAWQRLSPEFQAASGGFESYQGFWSTVTSAVPQGITADPDSDTVSYTVTYTSADGGTTTDQVTLRLVPQDGSKHGFVIAEES